MLYERKAKHVTLTLYSSPKKGDTTTLGAKGPVKLKDPPAAKGRSILRTFPSAP